MPPPRRHRRSTPPLAIWVLMLLCAAAVYHQRERLFSDPGLSDNPPTPGATEPTASRDTLDRHADDAPADGTRPAGGAGAPATNGARSDGGAELAPGPSADPPDVGPPTPAATDLTATTPPRDTPPGTSPGLTPDSPTAPSLSPADAQPPRADFVRLLDADRVPATPAGTALPLLDGLLADDALARADELRELGRLDEVFTAAEALTHAGLASGRLRAWRTEHDALLPERAALLRTLADHAARDAELAHDRDLPLLAALRADEARALLDTLARLRVDTTPDAQHAELDARVDAVRAALHDDPDVVTGLAARGARLPAHARFASASTERRWDASDARRAEQGGPATRTRGRISLESELPTGVAERLLESAEAALDAAESRWPTGSRDAVQLVVHARLSAFERDADDSDVEDVHRVRAFLDTGADPARVVSVDPRERGESTERLTGLLARELARWTLRRAHDVGEPLPAWLEEGWARDFERWARRADGDGWALAAPTRLRARLLADLGQAGAGKADLDSLLALRPASEREGPAAWSFVRHLERAVDAEGEPLFAEDLARLVSSRRDGLDVEPAVELQLRFTRSDAQRAAGLVSLPRLQAHWHDAERRAATRDTSSDAGVVAELWGPLDAALARRENDAVAERLGELSWLRPLDPALRQRRTLLTERRAERDARLLEALLLVRCADTDEPTREEGWAHAQRVNRAIATQLRMHQERGHEAALRLVERHLAEDRAEGARLLLDLLHACQPSDPRWTRLADGLPVRGLDGAPLELRVHPLLHADGRGTTSEPELWQRDTASLRARTEASAQASALHALWPLRTPFALEARLELVIPVPLRSGELHRRLGFSFGARHELDPGAWALLFGPGRQVELGVRGHHEWPAWALGTAPPRVLPLSLHVDRGGLAVRVGEHALPWQAAGARELDGGLGVLARQIDAQVTQLAVDLRPRVDPRGRWELVGGP